MATTTAAVSTAAAVTSTTLLAATTSTTSLAAAATTSTSSLAAVTTSTVARAATTSVVAAAAAAAVSSTSSASSSSASSHISSSAESSTSAHSTSTTATINSSSVLAFISQSADGSTRYNAAAGNGLKGGIIGAIVAGVVGGIVLLFVVYKLLKRRRGKLNAERNPPPPPRDMAYIGSAGMAHRRNQSMNMNRASSYNNLMSPPLSHYGSQGMLKGSSDTPSEIGALDSALIGESPVLYSRDVERGYAPATIESNSPMFPQADHTLKSGGLMAPTPRSMSDARTDDVVSAPPSSSPSPVPFDNVDGLALGMRPVATGDGSSGGDRTTASASRSTSDSSTTSSPRLLAEGSQVAHRSQSHNQLPRVPTHLRNLTGSTSASYGGYGAFGPGSRPTSHNSLSSMTGGRPRQLSGTPHHGRAIVLSMPQPLSETTELDGYLPPSPNMYGQHGQGLNEFGAYHLPPSSSASSSAGRRRRSQSPSLVSNPPSMDRRRP